ncbi:fatty acid hydroxylase domain-containing protein 2-like [Stegodyphus dumicola]|uniref:fatty acid hydroxylase domain-containing protein 2-like n=1 Tax=Stegodyphus dumicola TaxID=202533 RepID=UPI0015A87714|nr:fatty acid hydroxylase domain-containing protein 2-like [Stegodyphus dumicola]
MEMHKFIENPLNEAWLAIYHLSNGSEVVLNVVIPLIIMLTVYWIVSAFFTFIDMTGKPEFLKQFKIPDPNVTKYPIVTPEKLQNVIRNVLINQTLIAVPVIYLCFVLKRYRGYDNGIQLPSIQRFIFDILMQVLMEEIFFYYSHRLLHHSLFYKRYHKKHHEWISPVGPSAIYCHPVEHVLSNVWPTFIGSVIAGSHVTSLWAWLTFATAYGVIVHSGYHLPLTPTPEFHHYHHLKFNENFGVAGILDWLHGTDKQFRKSQAYERNRVLFSLTPLH